LSTQAVIANLQAATLEFVAGALGERELIAVTMAVNAELERTAGPSYAPMAKESEAALLERIAELDRGEP